MIPGKSTSRLAALCKLMSARRSTRQRWPLEWRKSNEPCQLSKNSHCAGIENDIGSFIIMFAGEDFCNGTVAPIFRPPNVNLLTGCFETGNLVALALTEAPATGL